MIHHKSLSTLPVACYDNYVKSGNIAWICIFDYKTGEPPTLTEEEQIELKDVFEKMTVKIPDGILSDYELFLQEQICLAEYNMILNEKYKDISGNYGHQKYHDAKYEYDKYLKEISKDTEEPTENSIFNQCIFIELSLKYNQIDIFEMPTLKYFMLLKLAIEQNEKQNQQHLSDNVQQGY